MGKKAKRTKVKAGIPDNVRESLVVLRISCLEGYDGTWDCSTDEGKEAFLDMVDLLDKVAADLGLTLTPACSKK